MAAWTTTPTTATAGASITAALWNSDVRDFGNAFGAWTSYTPTLGVFTAGNGTATGAYMQVGKLVVFRAKFVLGSTSAAASGAPTLTLPVTATGDIVTLEGQFYDSSGTAWYGAGTIFTSTAVALAVRGTNDVYANCSTTSPFTWATGDSLRVGGVYEAA